MQNYQAYQELLKPDWAPPSWIFGPVWAVLYIIIAISFIYVFYSFFKKRIPNSVALPFVLNLFFNFAFTPIQFGLRNNILATLDILLVFATLIWALIVVRPYAKWVTLVNIPYLLWVSFATVLQITVTILNS